MALGIPLPGQPGDALLKGINTGSGMFSRLMTPIVQREQLAQQMKIHQDSLAMQKAAAGRAAALAPLQKMMLEQQLLKLQHSNDPNYEFQQFKALQDMITSGGQGGGNMQGMPQEAMPTQEMGQGMGMFSPEGLGQAQQAPQQEQQFAPQGQGGMNFDALRQNPMLRGFFKHKFGFDPLAAVPQTPEDKQAASLDLFKQKEALKAQNKGGDTPTNTVLTQNQQAIQGIDSSLPIIDELINDKNLPGITSFSPGQKAKYIAKTGGVIDTLVAAQNLPKVQASIDLVEQQIRRHAGETLFDYKERLKDLKKDLIKRRERAQSVVKTRKVNTQPLEDFSSMSDEELHKIAGGG
jgi:hypothetical protein